MAEFVSELVYQDSNSFAQYESQKFMPARSFSEANSLEEGEDPIMSVVR